MSCAPTGDSPLFTQSRSFASAGKQVLRACGAQDDNGAAFWEGGRETTLPFLLLPKPRGVVILSERAARASEGSVVPETAKGVRRRAARARAKDPDRKSTRLNSSHPSIS